MIRFPRIRQTTARISKLTYPTDLIHLDSDGPSHYRGQATLSDIALRRSKNWTNIISKNSFQINSYWSKNILEIRSQVSTIGQTISRKSFKIIYNWSNNISTNRFKLSLIGQTIFPKLVQPLFTVGRKKQGFEYLQINHTSITNKKLKQPFKSVRTAKLVKKIGEYLIWFR